MNCHEIKTALNLFVAGECNKNDQQVIKDHLDRCIDCKRLYEETAKSMCSLEENLKDFLVKNPRVSLGNEKVVHLMQDQLLTKMVKNHFTRNGTRLFPIFISVAAVVFLTLAVFIILGNPDRTNESKGISKFNTITTNSASVKASLQGKDLIVGPYSEVGFVSEKELELKSGKVEVHVYKLGDFTVRTKMGCVKARGTKFEVRLSVFMVVLVTTGVVDVSTDYGDIVLDADDAAIIEPNKPPQKIDDIGKLKAKYPEVFKMIESKHGLERSAGVTHAVKYSKLNKDEKEQLLKWVLDTHESDTQMILAALDGLMSIKASGKGLEDTFKRLFSNPNPLTIGYLTHAIGELGVTSLKEELISTWKTGWEDKDWESKNWGAPNRTIKTLWKLGMSKEEFDKVFKACPHHKHLTFMDPAKSGNLKEAFGELLDKSDPQLLAAGIIGIAKLKATEFKTKLFDIVKSSKGSLKYNQHLYSFGGPTHPSQSNTIGKLAISALSQICSKEDKNELLELLEHKEEVIKCGAVYALISVGVEKCEEKLANLLSDKSSNVTLAAIWGLTKLKAKGYADKILEQITKKELPSYLEIASRDFLYYDQQLSLQSILASVFKDLFDDTTSQSLVDVYRKIGLSLKRSDHDKKWSILHNLVERRVKEVLPIVLDELKSEKLMEFGKYAGNVSKLSDAVSKLGSAKENGNDVIDALKNAKDDFGKIACIDILQSWKAKEHAEDMANLLGSGAIVGVRSLKFLIELDCVTKDMEDKIKKLFKESIGKTLYITGFSFVHTMQMVDLVKKNKFVSTIFIDILLGKIESGSDVKLDHYNGWYKDVKDFLGLLDDTQTKRLEEAALKRVKKGDFQFVSVLDYSKYKNELLKAAIEVLDSTDQKMTTIVALNNKTRHLLYEQLNELPVLDGFAELDYLTANDIFAALVSEGYKLEFNYENKEIESKSGKWMRRTWNQSYRNLQAFINNLEYYYGLYPIVEPDKKIIIFDDLDQVRKYLRGKLDN